MCKISFGSLCKIKGNFLYWLLNNPLWPKMSLLQEKSIKIVWGGAARRVGNYYPIAPFSCVYIFSLRNRGYTCTLYVKTPILPDKRIFIQNFCHHKKIIIRVTKWPRLNMEILTGCYIKPVNLPFDFWILGF